MNMIKSGIGDFWSHQPLQAGAGMFQMKSTNLKNYSPAYIRLFRLVNKQNVNNIINSSLG